MRITLPLNSFSSIGPGQKATTKLAGDRRIHATILKTNAADATELNAMVREVHLKLGSFNLVKLSIPELYLLLAYYGIAVNPGEIPLYFSRPQVRTPTGEEFTALNAFGLTDLTIGVEFRSNAEYNTIMSVGTGFDPEVSGIAEFDLFNDGNRSFIQIEQRTIANSGSGKTDFDTLEREGAYKAIHLLSNLVTQVQVYRDGLEIADRTIPDVDAINKRYGLARQTNHFPMDFGYTNQAQDVLEMESRNAAGQLTYKAKTFNLKINTTGAGSLPAVVERAITV